MEMLGCNAVSALTSRLRPSFVPSSLRGFVLDSPLQFREETPHLPIVHVVGLVSDESSACWNGRSGSGARTDNPVASSGARDCLSDAVPAIADAAARAGPGMMETALLFRRASQLSDYAGVRSWLLKPVLLAFARPFERAHRQCGPLMCPLSRQLRNTPAPVS